MPSMVAPTTNKAKIIKIKKNILAILVAPDSTPLNPKSPAMTAMMKKTNAYVSMIDPYEIVLNG